MTIYNHILVPTDFSTYSENAAARAKALSTQFGAGITLLHVVDYMPPGYVAAELPQEFSAENKVLERAQGQLSAWASNVDLAQADQRVSIGSARHDIVRCAKEVGADLIVIGTAGMGALKRMLGSTTNGVLHDAPCDVLSVQAIAEPE